MNIKFQYIITSIVFLLVTSSCNKIEYIQQETFDCELNSSEHINHQKYQAILDDYTINGIIGMTTIISKPNEDLWIGSSGFASIEENIKMNNCNLHQTASLAKSAIGVMTLQLIEEGLLEFDTKIDKHLSEVTLKDLPNAESLTIKHLLQQTSGLPDIFGLPFIADFMNKPEDTYTQNELLEYARNQKEVHAPGTDHYYSDTNFILLSLIIDKIEGDHVSSMESRIADKLQLNDFYYHTSTYPEIDGLPQSYWDQYNSGNIENISTLQKRVTNFIKGSDGIISSPLDIFNFYKNVFEGDLLSEETIELIKNEIVEEKLEMKMNTGYSHGFMTIADQNQTWIGHAGSQLGTSCFVFYNVDTKVTIAAFTNTGTFLFQEKQSLIYSELWEDLKKAIQ